MTMDTYKIYSEWARHMGYAVPTREQWSAWCRQPSRPSTNDPDIEAELRDGWACDLQYGERL